MIWILVLALLLGGALILFLRGEVPIQPYKNSGGPRMHRLGERPPAKTITDSEKNLSEEELNGFKTLSLDQLENFCRKLMTRSGLNFKHIDHYEKEGFYILSTYDKPLLRGNIIIHGILAGDSGVINSSEVIGFSDMVKAERAMKGVYVTNGFFSEEVMKLNEGAAIELIDVNQLAALMADISPESLPKPVKLVD